MSARRWAWVVWSVTMVVALVRPAIAAFDDSSTEQFWEYLFLIGVVVASATVGALITSRQPGNRVGLLFATLAGAASVSVTSGAYSSLAAGSELPLAGYAAWLSQLAFAITLYPLAFLFLLFPTGRVPTHRWRWVLRVMLVAAAVNVTLFALTPGVIESGMVQRGDGIRNPLALPEAWREVIIGITELAGMIFVAGALLGVVSLVLRFRRADAEQRQQIRWLAYLGVFLGVWVVALIALISSGAIPEDEPHPIGTIAFFVIIIGLFFGVPATCAIAILRYRLYELDVVVKKAVVAFLLGAVVTAVAVLVAIAVPVVVLGTGADRASVAAVAVGVGIGLLLSPFRRRARRWADRIVYGRRATPYEVLTEFGGRAAQTYATDDVLPRLAKVLAEGTGATTSKVLLRVGGELREAAAWGNGEAGDGADHVESVTHQGEELGALAVTMPANDPMDPAKEKLIRDLAAQAGLVLRNVRLIEELRESRRRIVTAQDERAKKLERDIHDGAQQQLVALTVQLRLLEQQIERDPEAAKRAAARLQDDATNALEDLRDLARGIYPPLLADQGLAVALETQARKASVPVTVEAGDVGRAGQEIEAAVYFSCLEALQNVAKYAGASRAEIRLRNGAGALTFEVSDDGRGFDPDETSHGTGLQGIADRLAAIGGTLEIRSEPGRGTTVRGSIPTEGRP